MASARLILERFEKVLRDRSRDVAVYALSEEHRLSFGALQERADGIAAKLDARRLPPGSLVLSLAGNRASSIALFLACLMRELVLLPLDGASNPGEVSSLAGRYGARALVTRSDSPWQSATAPLELPGALSLSLLDVEPDDETALSLSDAVLLKLTSGTTGRPRSVLASERHLVNDFRHIVEAMGIGPEDVSYGTIPLWHSYGVGNLVMPLLCQGSPLALRETFVPGRFVEDVRTTGTRVFPGVPLLFEHVLRACDGGRLPGSLRLLLSAGAKLEPSRVVAFARVLGRKIHSFYGTSETGGITYDAGEELPDPDVESVDVGRPLPETEVRVRPSDGRVLVVGTAVADGYVPGDGDDDDERAPAFTEEGFLTSDLGELDPSGRLVLSGRVSSFVNVAGRKVDPAECERVIHELPGVEAVKVLGVPCPHRGQKLVAFVAAPSGGPSSSAIREHCATKLSAHKIPRDVITLERLPVNARGKTDRAALEALAALER